MFVTEHRYVPAVGFVPYPVLSSIPSQFVDLSYSYTKGKNVRNLAIIIVYLFVYNVMFYNLNIYIQLIPEA